METPSSIESPQLNRIHPILGQEKKKKNGKKKKQKKHNIPPLNCHRSKPIDSIENYEVYSVVFFFLERKEWP